MFSWLNNIRIGRKLVLVIALPILGLLYFSAESVWQRYQQLAEMQHVGVLVHFAPYVSAAIGELQKERGRSAGFIASKGQTFTREMPAQRSATDTALGAYEERLTEFLASDLSDLMRKRVAEASEAVTRLSDMRQSIDRQGATVSDMAAYYSGTIAGLIALLEEIQHASTIDSVSKAVSSYINIIEAKESAGLERAMGAVGFGKGEFEPKILQRFVSLIAAQDAYINRFNSLAHAHERRFLAETVSGDAEWRLAPTLPLG